MKKSIICLLSLIAVLSCFAAGCHSGQTGSGQSLNDRSTEIIQTEQPSEGEHPELPPDGEHELPPDDGHQMPPDDGHQMPPEDGRKLPPPPPKHGKKPHGEGKLPRGHRKKMPYEKLPEADEGNEDNTPCEQQ
jgi:hypothetical protein